METQKPIEFTTEEALAALRQVLKEERNAYWDAQAKAKNGLKSGPFRQLERDGRLNAEFFLDEASRIMAKTSNLSAGQRAYISAVMDKAVQQALSKRAADKAEKAAKKAAAAKVRKSTATNKKPAKSNGNAAKSHKTTTKSNATK